MRDLGLAWDDEDMQNIFARSIVGLRVDVYTLAKAPSRGLLQTLIILGNA